jgi:ABC-type proline/glycine betaine transport system ATPase subunit
MIVLRAGRVEQRGSWRDLERAPCNEFVRNFVAAQTRAVGID